MPFPQVFNTRVVETGSTRKQRKKERSATSLCLCVCVHACKLAYPSPTLTT